MPRAGRFRWPGDNRPHDRCSRYRPGRADDAVVVPRDPSVAAAEQAACRAKGAGCRLRSASIAMVTSSSPTSRAPRDRRLAGGRTISRLRPERRRGHLHDQDQAAKATPTLERARPCDASSKRTLRRRRPVAPSKDLFDQQDGHTCTTWIRFDFSHDARDDRARSTAHRCSISRCISSNNPTSVKCAGIKTPVSSTPIPRRRPSSSRLKMRIYQRILWRTGRASPPLRQRFVVRDGRAVMEDLDATPGRATRDPRVKAGALVVFHGQLPHYSAPIVPPSRATPTAARRGRRRGLPPLNWLSAMRACPPADSPSRA